MIRLALISDIHSNLPALRAVLADIDQRHDVTAIYHLGDLTGYAPWPMGRVAPARARHTAFQATMIDRGHRLQALWLSR
jgi:hypothetical protein